MIQVSDIQFSAHILAQLGGHHYLFRCQCHNPIESDKGWINVDYTSAGWVAHHMERLDSRHTAFAVGCHTPGVVGRHRPEGQRVDIGLNGKSVTKWWTAGRQDSQVCF